VTLFVTIFWQLAVMVFFRVPPIVGNKGYAAAWVELGLIPQGQFCNARAKTF
jgi:hypothetical protein